MIKKFLPSSLITLVILTTCLSVVFMANVIAQSKKSSIDIPVQKPVAKPIAVSKDSVLHLIPQASLGLIYCPSLNELNHRINIAASGLMPQAGGTELLATILANAFGAGFQSLAELEEIGLDLEKDFALFFTSLKPMQASAAIHLTDPTAIKQVIEAEGNTSTEYKGVAYWSSAEGGSNFAILDNILVFSQQTEVCQNVIDTHKGTMQAIMHTPNYQMFLTDILKGADQLGVFFDIEAIMNQFGGSLEDELVSMVKTLEGENDSLSMETPSFLGNSFSRWTKPIEQLQFVSAFLQVQDMDIQLKPFLKFKNDSEFLNAFKTVSTDLTNLDKLPNHYMLNGSFQGTPNLLVYLSTFWLDVFPKDPPGQEKQEHPLFQEVKGFYESLADRWTFSLNFESSIVPDCLFVYELKDEQSAKTFMDEEFLKKLHDHYDVSAGKPIMHNGIEIKSYVFPNISETIVEKNPEFSGTLPAEWHWYYAFSEGKLISTAGTSSESIKNVLDRQAGIAEDKFSENPSYQKLTDTLGTDNNIFLAFSPIIAVKNMVPLLAKTDTEGAASIQMFSVMFMNLPDNYSVGFSAKVEDSGIASKLLLTLGDFKQLFQMFGMFFGGSQMQ